MTRLLWSVAALICLSVILELGECRTVVKREASLNEHQMEELTKQKITRDKRAVDVVTGVKNAVLGFVFNKLNAFIDQKTHWIDQLDKQNIAKNAAANIVPPSDPVTSLSAVISGAIGQKLEAASPFVNVIFSKLSSASAGGSGGSGGFNIGSLFGGSSGGSSGGGDAHDA